MEVDSFSVVFLVLARELSLELDGSAGRRSCRDDDVLVLVLVFDVSCLIEDEDDDVSGPLARSVWFSSFV